MSIAPRSYTYLCSSQSLTRTTAQLPKAKPPLSLQFAKPISKNHSLLIHSISFCNTHLLNPSILTVKASETEAKISKSEKEEEENEEYEVELVQPYGLKFMKGRYSRAYIDAIGAGGSADKSGMFTVGDKCLERKYGLLLNMREPCTPSARKLAHYL